MVWILFKNPFHKNSFNYCIKLEEFFINDQKILVLSLFINILVTVFMIIYCQFLYLFNDKLEKFLDFQVIRLAKNYVVGIYMICNLYTTCNVKKRGNKFEIIFIMFLFKYTFNKNGFNFWIKLKEFVISKQIIPVLSLFFYLLCNYFVNSF